MRQAFTLLGIMTLIVAIGAFIAFKDKAEAPVATEEKQIEEIPPPVATTTIIDESTLEVQ